MSSLIATQSPLIAQCEISAHGRFPARTRRSVWSTKHPVRPRNALIDKIEYLLEVRGGDVALDFAVVQSVLRYSSQDPKNRKPVVEGFRAVRAVCNQYTGEEIEFSWDDEARE